MSKVYKGYELIEKASKNEIADYTKFKSIDDTDMIIFCRQQCFWTDIDKTEVLNSWFIDNEWEIIEEEPEIDIQGIEPLDAYKLMEAPFMADKLKGMNYDTFMEHLKQSEIEIANKIIELIRAVKQLDNQINNK